MRALRKSFAESRYATGRDKYENRPAPLEDVLASAVQRIMRPRFDVLCVFIAVVCLACGALLGFGPADDAKATASPAIEESAALEARDAAVTTAAR